MINIENKDWHGVCYQINHCVNNNESLEINMTAVRDVLWLDPVEKIDASARAQMRVAGLNVVVVNTLEELNTMLGRVDLVVVRLVDDTSLLAEVRGLAGESMVDLPVVCRVGRGNLELAVAAMRDGARAVEEEGHPAVLVVSPVIRGWLSKAARYRVNDLTVLSYSEIPDDQPVKVIHTVSAQPK